MTHHEPPFAYTQLRGRDDTVVAVEQTLHAVSRGTENDQWGCSIYAWWPDGIYDEVPREAYVQPAPPTREEALTFIRGRQQRIEEKQALQHDTSLTKLLGLGRCNSDDPEEAQVQDYIATAPWRVRPVVDEGWWATGDE